MKSFSDEAIDTLIEYAAKRPSLMSKIMIGNLLEAVGKEKYELLVTLKNKYDHTKFFSLNQNIKPGK